MARLSESQISSCKWIKQEVAGVLGKDLIEVAFKNVGAVEFISTAPSGQGAMWGVEPFEETSRNSRVRCSACLIEEVPVNSTLFWGEKSSWRLGSP